MEITPGKTVRSFTLQTVCQIHYNLAMHSVLTLGLLAAVAVAAPAPQLIDLTPGYSKGDSNPARFRYYENQDFLQGPCDITTGPDGNIW